MVFYERFFRLPSLANMSILVLTTHSYNSLHMCFSPTFGHEFLLGRDCVSCSSLNHRISGQWWPQRRCWVNRSFRNEHTSGDGVGCCGLFLPPSHFLPSKLTCPVSHSFRVSSLPSIRQTSSKSISKEHIYVLRQASDASA